MFEVAKAWFRGQETLNFEVYVPPEMREGMTQFGVLAPRISRAEALQVPAVMRGRNLICATIGGLPIHLRNKDREIVEGSAAPTTLFDQVDPDVPNIITFTDTLEDLLFEQESWWRVLERNFAGWPTYCEHIDKQRIFIDQGRGQVYLDGDPIPNEDAKRFYGPNPGLLLHAARAIRTCLTLDTAASRYADEPMPLGYFTPREGRRVGEDDQKTSDFLDKWRESIRKRAWGWIPSAVEAKTLQFNAEQIQLAEQRQHAVLEIARAMGVDPEDLGVSTTSRTYQNSEQRRQDLLDFTLAAYMKAVEQRLSMNDFTPRGYRAKFNLDAFLRGDTKTRMETYEIGKPLGVYPPERIAELEDIPSARPSPPQLVPVPNQEEPSALASGS